MKKLSMDLINKHYAEIIGFCKPLVMKLNNNEEVSVNIPYVGQALRLEAGVVDNANDHYCAAVHIGKHYTFASKHYFGISSWVNGALVGGYDTHLGIYDVSEDVKRALVKNWSVVKKELLQKMKGLLEEEEEVDDFVL